MEMLNMRCKVLSTLIVQPITLEVGGAVERCKPSAWKSFMAASLETRPQMLRLCLSAPLHLHSLCLQGLTGEPTKVIFWLRVKYLSQLIHLPASSSSWLAAPALSLHYRSHLQGASKPRTPDACA
eukprot:2464288-Amphidinium_carterae.2